MTIDDETWHRLCHQSRGGSARRPIHILGRFREMKDHGPKLPKGIRMRRCAPAILLLAGLSCIALPGGAAIMPQSGLSRAQSPADGLPSSADILDCRALQCRLHEQQVSVNTVAKESGAAQPKRGFFPSLVPDSSDKTSSGLVRSPSEPPTATGVRVAAIDPALIAAIAAISAPATNSETCNQQTDPLGQMQGCAAPPKPPCTSEGTALTPGVTCQAPEPPMLGLVGAALALLALTLRRKPQQA